MAKGNIRFREPRGWRVAQQSGARGGRGVAQDPLDLFVEAAEKHDLRLDEDARVDVRPDAGAGGAVGGRGATALEQQPGASEDLEIDVDLAPGEDAAALVETDGILTWHFAESKPITAVGGRGAGALSDGRSQATIRIRLGSPSRAAGGRIAEFLGVTSLSEAVAKVAGEALRVTVFRFAGKLVAKGAVRFLERHVEVGPVVVDRLDLVDSAGKARWAPDQVALRDARARLPKDRPARVLLLCHGTFSSVAGSFGALTSHPEGRAFLERAIGTATRPGHYDLIVGYDHRTLSQTPLENAVEIFETLFACDFAHPPEIDAIAFSRGGLVLRSLLELVLPRERWAYSLGSCVFVGCTNNGTLLASRECWQDFLNRFTNVAVAASRVVAFLGSPPAAAAIATSAASVGALVRWLATASTDPNSVPGLAAMSPEGDFVREIQGLQEGQPQPKDCRYHVIEAAFSPGAAINLVIGDEEARERYGMSKSLLLALASVATQTAWREANDLVVHTASMSDIEGRTSGFVKGQLRFGPGEAVTDVYHTIYFTRPEVAKQLSAWFLDPAGGSP